MKKMTKTNIEHLDELYNFVVENFFIWINLPLQNVLWNFLCLVQKKNTRQKSSLPSVQKKHSAKSQIPVVIVIYIVNSWEFVCFIG
jgi:hypothetical protein